MQNGMYPGFAKLQTLSESSKFVNASQLQASETITQENVVESETTDDNHKQNILQSGTMNPGYTQKPNNLKATIKAYESQSKSARNFIFTRDVDNLELCIPHSKATNGFDHGKNTFTRASYDNYSDDATSIDRRRKGHGRRSNRNIEQAPKMNWSRNNITATMERFEPTQRNRPPSSASSLDYGLAASVVTSMTETPHFSQIKHSPEVASYEIKTLREAGSMNHAYSYAYHEPGAVKSHMDVSWNTGQTLNITTMGSNTMESSKDAPHNRIRTVLSKSFRSKSTSGQSTSPSPCVEDRHTYTTRYGTTENLYEEVNEQKIRKVLSDNRIEVSAANYVKEELRRVQHNHFRVLEELNLSLEALIMPPSPLNLSPNTLNDEEDTTGNVATSEAIGTISTASTGTSSSAILPQKPRRFGLLGGDSSSLFPSDKPNGFSNTSLENLSATFISMDLKDQSHNSANNPDFDEGDLDSGFSGSGSSSGASYNDSLRDYKTGSTLLTRNQALPHTKNLCCSPTSSGIFTSKSSVTSVENSRVYNRISCGKEMSRGSNDNEVTSFDFVRVCPDAQHLAMRTVPAKSSTGNKSKKSIWSMKP